MKHIFYKYQGTGNDFIILDNRDLNFPKNDTKLIKFLCDRRFGIGADGLMLLENDKSTDFKMVYYNADGNESSMCGNGGRCLVAFAKKMGVIQDSTTFVAVDGIHHARITKENLVSLQMIDVASVQVQSEYVFLNTGSPHHVQEVEELKQLDVKKEGAKIRYSHLYGQEGSNINFVIQKGENNFAIRTYERGVEDETLSCGTGATAVALAMYHLGKATSNTIAIQVEGGQLQIAFQKSENGYKNIQLTGPAQFVFQGEIDV
ncbi:diaminopimelate epimerase [Flavobacterium columnare]|uniref:Diaminopimelate epimerase n=2 Tax=Flavobacterium columnare TaxID=996 RepID=G8X8E2_FLACA|nr:diaminopimelate epimerase [Flavobacterium columnare]AEW85776.1 diaminopimelate epimerase [Flavobacterium columnare ATCC 49512]AMO21363.1 diaminopimelate epimerase [Flavobacterium columnare]ANO47858.1 diaminopimelate epimerase [Flavobacterium columnare]APT21548.1 diaminopimelate epimerase [Flavobacterium columnare]AUX19407.1 diaminopimelate epimerase [Flavobacterium columnare]